MSFFIVHAYKSFKWWSAIVLSNMSNTTTLQDQANESSKRMQDLLPLVNDSFFLQICLAVSTVGGLWEYEIAEGIPWQLFLRLYSCSSRRVPAFSLSLFVFRTRCQFHRSSETKIWKDACSDRCDIAASDGSKTKTHLTCQFAPL